MNDADYGTCDRCETLLTALYTIKMKSISAQKKQLKNVLNG